jgi:hypothetical protein
MASGAFRGPLREADPDLRALCAPRRCRHDPLTFGRVDPRSLEHRGVHGAPLAAALSDNKAEALTELNR